MIRIAYVLDIFPKLSETFIAGELAELRRRGVELRVLSLRHPREELQHEIIGGAGLDRITSYDVAGFGEIISEFRPDLLHAHFAKDATAKAWELSSQSGVPFSFTAHGYDIHRKPPPDFKERAAAALALVTVSAANAAYIHAMFGIPRSQIRVIPCGVDTDYFRPLAPPAAALNPPLLLCVARHVPVKNLGLLLEACALLRTRGINFRCVMLGDGPLHQALLDARTKLGLERSVYLPGAANQSEVLKWWQQASVGVLTSDNEGMPVCLMEAAACGVPVVATRVGGIPELVQECMTGLLVPAGDASACANALGLLLTDAPLRKRMGMAARARAVQYFSVTRQVDSLLTLWSQTLERAAA